MAFRTAQWSKQCPHSGTVGLLSEALKVGNKKHFMSDSSSNRFSHTHWETCWKHPSNWWLVRNMLIEILATSQMSVPDIKSDIKVLAKSKHKFSKIVSADDVRLCQPDFTKNNIKEVWSYQNNVRHCNMLCSPARFPCWQVLQYLTWGSLLVYFIINLVYYYFFVCLFVSQVVLSGLGCSKKGIHC